MNPEATGWSDWDDDLPADFDPDDPAERGYSDARAEKEERDDDL